MYAKQPKKLLIVNILEILRKYSDENHRFSQKEIGDLLSEKYDMKVERKAIRRNLLDLIDSGYDIRYSESVRMVPMTNKETGKTIMEENVILSDFYMVPQFTDGELRLIIDSLLFLRQIPYNQRKVMVEKLETMASVDFNSRVAYIPRLPEDAGDNRQLFYNLELLDEAINKGLKVAFKYSEYGTDKKVYMKKSEDGTVKEYVINPYQTATKDGKYYLICNYDKYDDISNYRIDRIRDVRILKEKVKPFEQLHWSEDRPLDLAVYNMYASPNLRVKLRVTKGLISDIIDTFGKEIRFFDEDETSVSVAVRANEATVEQFVKNYSPYVMLLEPRCLVDKIVTDMEEMVQKYKKMKGQKDE